MKPETLLEQLEQISPDYIEEARPHVSRIQTQSAVTDSRTFAEICGDQGTIQRHTGKDRSMKGNIIQRVTTGLVAVAACAVFVGSGFFILQQEQAKRQDSHTPAAEIEEQIPLNFLGGIGTVSVMYGQPDHTNPVFYDGSSFYISRWQEAVPREGAALTAAQSYAEQINAILPEDGSLLTDGEQLYCSDPHTGTLYQISESGEKTEVCAVIADALESNIGFMPSTIYFSRMARINEDALLIALTAAKEDQPATAEVLLYVNTATGEQTFFSPNPNSLTRFLPAEDGTGAFITKVGDEQHLVEFIPAPNVHDWEGSQLQFALPEMSALVDWTISQGKIFYTDATEQIHVYDIETKSDSVLSGEMFGSLPFCCGDRLYGITQDHKKLWVSDADFSNVEYIAECTGEDAEKASALFGEEIGFGSIEAVSEDYAVISISPRLYAVVSLETGDLRLILSEQDAALLAEEQGDSTALPEVTTAAETADAQTTETTVEAETFTNFLGGHGEIRTVYDSGYANYVLRDDDYYYTDGKKWDVDGLNTILQDCNIHPVNQQIFTDGISLYCYHNDTHEFNHIDSKGNETKFFELDAKTLWGDTDDTVFTVDNFWHITGNQYMFGISSTDRSGLNRRDLLIWALIKPDGASGFTMDKFVMMGENDVTTAAMALMGENGEQRYNGTPILPAPEKNGFYYLDNNGQVVLYTGLDKAEETGFYAGIVFEGSVSPENETVIKWTIYDNTLYYFNAEQEYCAYQIDTKERTVLSTNLNSAECRFWGDQIWTLSDDRLSIVRYDLDLTDRVTVYESKTELNHIGRPAGDSLLLYFDATEDSPGMIQIMAQDTTIREFSYQ